MIASISKHWTRQVPLLIDLEVGMPLDNVLVGVEHVNPVVLLGLLHLLGGAVVDVNDGAVDGQHNGLPGSVVVKGALEAVSVSVELLSLGSLVFVPTSVFLDSA